MTIQPQTTQGGTSQCPEFQEAIAFLENDALPSEQKIEANGYLKHGQMLYGILNYQQTEDIFPLRKPKPKPNSSIGLGRT